MSSGSYGFDVQDNNGVQRFYNFKIADGFFGEQHFNRYLGITADDKSHTITVNINRADGDSGTLLGPGVATMAGQTDIFYFDDLTKNVIKRIELVNVISQQIQHLSQCVDVSYKNEALYVVDKGPQFSFRFFWNIHSVLVWKSQPI